MKRITVDYETRSEADLRKVGGWEYSKHPSTEVLCVGYKIDDGPTKIFYPTFGERPPTDFMNAWTDDSVIRVAHNAFFEQSITTNCLSRYLNPIYRAHFAFNPSRWKCTAAKARAHALPGKLEKPAEALKLPVQKDMIGHKLMMKLCKPRRTWLVKGTGDKFFGTREEILRLGEYCMKDVDAEYLIDERLADLSTEERKVWEMDQRINARGVRVDLDTCKLILKLIETESSMLKEEVNALTLGIVENATQRNEVLEFVRSEGFELPNLQAKTITKALQSGGMNDIARRLLEIRQVISKTSTAKFKRFVERAGSDSRVRDLLVYHGPSTGRWAGAGIQPQNFPRGIIEDTDQAIDIITVGDLELIRLLYADPMTTFSSCLRGMLTATPGKRIIAADYNAIETRVLWWLAEHKRGVQLFKDGVDSYKDMASGIFKKPVESITKNERQLGKKVVLGCGYGLGWKKFKQSCHDEGMESVDDELAKAAVYGYRDLHHPVKDLWTLLEKAAIYSVLNPTKKVRIKKVAWFVKGDFLFCELPSGRLLSYPYPRITFEPTPWGEPRPVLRYWGVDSFTKKWKEETTYGGKITENLVQAIARDVMVAGMFNAERAGYDILLTVHDELVTEKDEGDPRELENLMTTLPSWANGLPVKAEGWINPRYKK